MSVARRAPAAPRHLSDGAKKWWREVTAEYELEPHQRKLLQAAAEAWDRLQQARSALAKHGLTYEDRLGNPRARPEVAIERDARIAFGRLVRQLRFDDDSTPPPPEDY